jgi:hypothetical protein
MKVLEAFSHVLGHRNEVFVELLEVDGKLGVVAIINIKWGATNAQMLGIVV